MQTSTVTPATLKIPAVAERLFASETKAHEEILKGLPFDEVMAAVANYYQLSAIDTSSLLHVPLRTMQRWKTDKKKRLETLPSSRFYRLTMAVKDAMEIFGTREAAIDWFHEEQRALGFRRPIDMMVTDPGAASVERLLGRIRYGVFT